MISSACDGIAKIAAGYCRWSLARAIIRGRLAEPDAAHRGYRLALYSALRDGFEDERPGRNGGIRFVEPAPPRQPGHRPEPR